MRTRSLLMNWSFPMHISHTIRLTGLAFLVAIACAASPALAKSSKKSNSGQTVEIALAPAFGGGTSASGKVTFIDRSNRDEFTVRVEGLPMGSYDLFVGGSRIADFTVVPKGLNTEGIIEFDSKGKYGKRRLNFDPRGKVIEVRNTLMVVVAGTLPAAPPGQVAFSNYADNVVGQVPDSTVGRRPTGALKIRSTKQYAWMRFELQRFDRVSHTLTANGITIATFTPFSGGFARVQFTSDPSGNDLPLDFDPAGVVYRVLRGDDLIMEFVSDSGTIGGGMEPVRLSTAPLAPTGAQAPAQGAATLTARGSKLDLKIEIGNLIPGPYALRIAGSSEGVIHVSLSSDITRGLLELSNYRSGVGILPLGVDPRGRTVEVLQGDTVVLKTVYPNS